MNIEAADIRKYDHLVKWQTERAQALATLVAEHAGHLANNPDDDERAEAIERAVQALRRRNAIVSELKELHDVFHPEA